MRMGVEHGLPGVSPSVKDHPVSALRQTLLHCDPVRLGRHLVQEAVARGGDCGQIGEMHPRDDQDMHRRLRVYVTERNGAVTV
jgi:hypothetical protein